MGPIHFSKIYNENAKLETCEFENNFFFFFGKLEYNKRTKKQRQLQSLTHNGLFGWQNLGTRFWVIKIQISYLDSVKMIKGLNFDKYIKDFKS